MSFDDEGYEVADRLVEADRLPELRDEADRLLRTFAGRGGCRHALQRSFLFLELGHSSPLVGWAERLLGKTALPVKLTLFDKTPESNWKVPWHQDLTISVRERLEVPGFGTWSEKDGIPHVQPPPAILASIVAVRLHLDDAPAENGALRVLPGSHRGGKLSAADIERAVATTSERICSTPAGGAVAMSPLILHASSSSSTPSRRRVLHYEYSHLASPGGLEWHTPREPSLQV